MKKEEFVKVKDFISDAVIELKYATEDNFTGKIIYDFEDAYLRYGTVQKLQLVQKELKDFGYGIKIWDAFRPAEAQFKLWEVCPDETFVANPLSGYSSHSRGNTLDLTLVTLDGKEVEMPTGFDDFSEKAKRTYIGVTEKGKRNSAFLEMIMEKYGFEPYKNEWWHYSDRTEYSVEKEFRP